MTRAHRSGTTFFLVLAIFLAAAAAQADVGVGDPMPRVDERLPDVRGRLTPLDMSGDEGTLVVFTSGSCARAVALEETIVELERTFARRLVRTILIDVDDSEPTEHGRLAAMRQRSDELGIRFPYLADDGAVARAFGVAATPEAFLFDRGGKLVYRGAIAGGEAETHLKDALEAMVAREPIPVAVTEARGCPVALSD